MKRRSFFTALAGASLLGSPISPVLLNGITKRERGESRSSSVLADITTARDQFPSAEHSTYLNNAASHPLPVPSASALHRYADWVLHEHASYWPPHAPEQQEAKRLFARLIHAGEDEIAFARSTQEIENNILNGMNIQASGGNVVTNDLHFSGCLYNYRMRQERGLDVRIVPNRNWRVRAQDLERVVDRNTRLISLALVSNVNGYFFDDIKEISELAHANGALLFTDIIQCAGAVPINVKEMGIDMAACSTYKFLMGSKGFGFFYIRKDLQGDAVPPDRFQGGGVQYNYSPWTESPEPDSGRMPVRPQEGPRQYEVALPSYEGVICAQQSLRYILDLGVDRIRAHTRPLVDRMMQELPRIGYLPITPEGNNSPIVTFICPDPAETRRRLRDANVHVSIYFGDKLRVSPSVYNNQDDVSRLIDALS